MKSDKDTAIFETPFGEGLKEPQNETSTLHEGDGRSCSEAKRPDSEEIPEAAEGRGGSSNTPHTELKINTSIDYLKFRFDVGFANNREFFTKLFEELAMDPSEFGRGGVYNNYLNHLSLGVGAVLAYGGTMTLNSNGQETTLLELKGQACRQFEERRWRLDPHARELDWEKAINGYWMKLLELCKLEMQGTCTRIDMPTDCLDGFITVDEIRQKVKNREYTTNMRRLELTDDAEAPDFQIPEDVRKRMTGVATIRDSKLSGYTATFGSRKAAQLCIYDKAAEQWLKAGNNQYESWVRFEVRYYHDVADREILSLIRAMQDGIAKQHIMGCLYYAIKFKEPNSKDEKHRSEAKEWSKWTEMLRGARRGAGFAIVRGDSSIERNAKWAFRECAKTFARLSLAFELPPEAFSRALTVRGIPLLTAEDYQEINEYRERCGLIKIFGPGWLLKNLMDTTTGEIEVPSVLQRFVDFRKKKKLQGS